MERIGQIVILAAVSIYTVLAQPPTLTATGPTDPIEDGKEVILTCIVTDLDVYSQATKWFRVDNKDKALLKELSSHNVLSANPDHFGIAVAHDRATGETKYTLTIKGVKKTDDGFYKCAVFNTDTNEELTKQSVEIVFPQPIASLTLTVGSSKFDSGSKLNEVDVEQFDSAMPILCQALGSNPAPKMKITIGDTDVTSKFGREDFANPIGDTYMSVRGFDTDVDSTGKYQLPLKKAREPIVCKAWVGEEEDKALEVRAQLKLKEPPVTICKNRTTRLGDRRVPITCTITSSPKVTSPIWRVNGPEEMVKVPVTNSEVKGYTASVKHLNDTTIEVTISIDHVEKKHFATTFYLQANTEVQPVDHAVRIYESGSTGGQGRVLMPTAALLSVVMAGAVLKRLL